MGLEPTYVPRGNSSSIELSAMKSPFAGLEPASPTEGDQTPIPFLVMTVCSRSSTGSDRWSRAEGLNPLGSHDPAGSAKTEARPRRCRLSCSNDSPTPPHIRCVQRGHSATQHDERSGGGESRTPVLRTSVQSCYVRSPTVAFRHLPWGPAARPQGASHVRLETVDHVGRSTTSSPVAFTPSRLLDALPG